MHPTEPMRDRDEEAFYSSAPPPGEHQGTVPQLRPDTSPRVAEALALRAGQTPTKREVYELAGGMKADGSPIDRSKHAGRFTTKGGHARRDDTQGHARTDIIDVMLYPDISWGIAHANARTKAGRAVVGAVIRGAMDDTMARVEQTLGWTRRGKGGRLGPEAGDITWIRFLQQTPRPTADGRVAPGIHGHHMVPAVVVTESGHVGAIHTARKRGLTLGDYFAEQLAERGKAAGIDVELRDNGAGGKAAVVKAVPEDVRTMYARRAEEALADAQKWTARHGEDWDGLSPERKAQILHAGARRTQAAPRDGMADRALWRAEMAAMNFPPIDVARPRHAVPDAGHVLRDEASVLQRLHATRTSVSRTSMLVAQLHESAAMDGRPAPSPARQARIARAAEAVAEAFKPRRLMRELREVRDAIRQTAGNAARLADPIRSYFQRRRERKAAKIDALVAVVQGRPPKPEARLAQLRQTREAVGEIRKDAMTIEPARIRQAVTEAAVRRVVENLQPIRPPSTQRKPMRVEVPRHEAEQQLREALRQHGIKPDGQELHFDGRMHYLPVDGNRGREKSGAYRAYHDEKGASAALYNWKAAGHDRGFVGNWTARGEFKPLSAEQQAAMAERSAREKAARAAAEAARHERGARKARGAYSRAKPCPAAHPYLAAKGLDPVPGMRQDARGRIVVPLRAFRNGEAKPVHVNNQTIEPDGTKRPVTEAQKTGAFFVVGKVQADQPIIIAEGLATAMRIERATGLSVVMAIDSGNLQPVAEAIRGRAPDRPIILAADNDHHLPAREGDRARDNEGLMKATKAAQAVGGSVWMPPQLDERHARDKGTDWDDFAQARGEAAVAASLLRHLQEGKVEHAAASPWANLQVRGAAEAPRPAAPSEGEGQRM